MNVKTLTLYLYVTCTLRDVVTLTYDILNLESCHRSYLCTHPHAQYVIIRRSGQGSAFLGL